MVNVDGMQFWVNRFLANVAASILYSKELAFQIIPLVAG